MLCIKVLTVRFYTTFNKCGTQGTYEDRVTGTGARENRTDKPTKSEGTAQARIQTEEGMGCRCRCRNTGDRAVLD